jgi:hypothetical protein
MVNFYRSCSLVRIMKWRRLWCSGDITKMGEAGMHRLLSWKWVGKCLRKWENSSLTW